MAIQTTNLLVQVNDLQNTNDVQKVNLLLRPTQNITEFEGKFSPAGEDDNVYTSS